MAAVDAHLHLFRDEREGLLAQGGERRAGFAGVPDELAVILDRGRIARALVVTAAPVELWRRALRDRYGDELEEQVAVRLSHLNEWVCETARADGRLLPAIGAEATIDATRLRAEIHDKVSRHGVRVIKIHPALNFTFPTHPGYEPVFAAAREAGLVVVSHGGASSGPYESEVDYCAPAEFAPVLAAFPEVRVVVAHLAHPYVDDLVELAADHPNLYTDLSLVVGAGHLAGEGLRSAVRAFGFERVLFGSDFPYFDPEESLDRLAAAGLTDAELEAITAANAAIVLGL